MSAHPNASVGDIAELRFVPDKHFPSKVVEVLARLRSESARRGQPSLASLLNSTLREAVDLACHAHIKECGHLTLAAPVNTDVVDQVKAPLKTPRHTLEEMRLLRAVDRVRKEVTSAAMDRVSTTQTRAMRA